MSTFPDCCDRCGADLRTTSSIMSKFNTDIICSDCKRRERAHPAYEAADLAEINAVRSGQMNFPGVGCPAELRNAPRQAELALIAAGRDSVEQVAEFLRSVAEVHEDMGAESAIYRFKDGSALQVWLKTTPRFQIVKY